jgi:hypothetical protein
VVNKNQNERISPPIRLSIPTNTSNLTHFICPLCKTGIAHPLLLPYRIGFSIFGTCHDICSLGACIILVGKPLRPIVKAQVLDEKRVQKESKVLDQSHEKASRPEPEKCDYIIKRQEQTESCNDYKQSDIVV